MNNDQVRAMMDERYAKGEAYELSLPFDAIRMAEIRKTVLELVPDWYLLSRHTLDVGSGTAGIAPYWPHHDIVGVEISEEAVKVARSRFPDVDYRVGAIETWTPNSGEQFDLVVAVESIEHWSNSELGLETVRRALRPEGMFVMTTPNRDSLHFRIGKKLGIEVPKCSYDHVHEFGFAELIECVTAHGFIHEESRGVHLAPYWALESSLGEQVRSFTDNDEEVNRWLNDIGRAMPPEYAFIQCHRFRLA